MGPGHDVVVVDDDDDPFAQQSREVGGDDPTSPYPVLAELRSQSGVHAGMPELGVGPPPADEPPMFTAYSYDAVYSILTDHQTFSSSVYAEVIGMMMGRSILEMDEPEHRSYRLILQQAFSRASMRRWEQDTIRPIVERAIGELAPSGRAELVRDFCLSFPLRIIGSILGLPDEDERRFHRLAIEMINVTEFDRATGASYALRDYFAEILAERRRDPREDMISVLALAEHDGQRLTDDEIFAFLRLLLPAGAETAYRSSSSLLLALLADRDQLEAVRADRSLVNRAVDEAIRWEPPLLYIPRVCVSDTEVAGVPIPAGAALTCNLGAANHDPARFRDPDRYDIHREGSTTHVGFGYGVHTCLGIHLAKIETAAVVDIVLDRLPDIRLDPAAPPPFIAGQIMRSASRLDVVW